MFIKTSIFLLLILFLWSTEALDRQLAWPTQWNQVNPTPTSAFLSGAALCADGGWLVAGAQSDRSSSLAVLRSEDLGQTWTQLTINATFGPEGYSFSSFIPVSVTSCGSLIFVMGSTSSLATPDCGRTWIYSSPELLLGQTEYPSCALVSSSSSTSTTSTTTTILVAGFGKFSTSTDGLQWNTIQLDGNLAYWEFFGSALASPSSNFGGILSPLSYSNALTATFACTDLAFTSAFPCGNFSAFFPTLPGGFLTSFSPFYDPVTQSYLLSIVFGTAAGDSSLAVLHAPDLLPSSQTTPWRKIFSIQTPLPLNPGPISRWGKMLYLEAWPFTIFQTTSYYASSDNGLTWARADLPALPLVVKPDALAFQLGKMGMLGVSLQPQDAFHFHAEGITAPFNGVAVDGDDMLIATSQGLVRYAVSERSYSVAFANQSVLSVIFVDSLQSFAAVVYNSSTAVSVPYLSADLRSWTALPGVSALQQLAYNNGSWVGMSSDGDVMYLTPSGWSNSFLIATASQLCYSPAALQFVVFTTFPVGVFLSPDGQVFEQMTVVPPGLSEECTLSCGPAATGALSGIYLACDDVVSVSMDGGAQWQTVHVDSPVSFMESMALSFLPESSVVVLSAIQDPFYPATPLKMLSTSSDGINFTPLDSPITPNVQLTNIYWSSTTSSLIAISPPTSTIYISNSTMSIY